MARCRAVGLCLCCAPARSVPGVCTPITPHPHTVLPFHTTTHTTAPGGQYNALMRLHNRQSVSDRAMQQATREINEYCERLRLVDTIRSHALEIFKDVSS